MADQGDSQNTTESLGLQPARSADTQQGEAQMARFTDICPLSGLDGPGSPQHASSGCIPESQGTVTCGHKLTPEPSSKSHKGSEIDIWLWPDKAPLLLSLKAKLQSSCWIFLIFTYVRAMLILLSPSLCHAWCLGQGTLNREGHAPGLQGGPFQTTQVSKTRFWYFLHTQKMDYWGRPPSVQPPGTHLSATCRSQLPSEQGKPGLTARDQIPCTNLWTWRRNKKRQVKRSF